MQELDLTIEEVDALTGAGHRPGAAAPPSAPPTSPGWTSASRSPRTSTRRCPRIRSARSSRSPDFMKAMVERGWLGEKTGARLLPKEGKRDPHPRLEDAGVPRAAQGEASPRSRPPSRWRTSARGCKQILAGKDKAVRSSSGACCRRPSLYAASLGPRDLRRRRCRSTGPWSGATAGAWVPSGSWTRWAWRRWPSGREARAAPVPRLVEALLASGRKRFYDEEDGRATVFGPPGVVPVPERAGRRRRWRALKAARRGAGRRTPAPAWWTWATASAWSSSTAR